MISQRYPSAGTNNVLVKLAVTDLSGNNKQWLDLGDEKDIYLPRVKWMADGQTLSYQIQSRDQQRLDLMAFNTHSKKQSTLLSETSDTWLNLHKDLRFLEDRKHFIWASERDGFKPVSYTHLTLPTN